MIINGKPVIDADVSMLIDITDADAKRGRISLKIRGRAAALGWPDQQDFGEK
jgi:hypothetical protein